MDEELLRQLVRQVQGKYYGKYRGFVTDNDDPDKRARLRLQVPSLLGQTETGWALPCLPFGGLADQGLFLVPEVGAQVWVEFEEGELSRPIWTGTFWQASGDPPTEAAVSPPTTRLLKTPGGHRLQFDDESGEEQIVLAHSGGAQLTLDAKGNAQLVDQAGNSAKLDTENGQIVVEDANGNTLTLSAQGVTLEDANGNKIATSAAGITVEGTQVVVKGQMVALGGEGGEPLIKGTSFLTLFATHVHPTGVGPSGPPIPQGETSSLSTKVMSA